MRIYQGANGGLVKAWTDGVQVEDQAQKQIDNLAAMPFIHSHLAVMPDVHWGMGATVGSVIPTKGAIIPAAVGVDIGCGMMARRTSLTANDLPDNLFALRTEIEKRVPHGRTDNGGVNDRGAWANPPSRNVSNFVLAPTMDDRSDSLSNRLDILSRKHPKIAQAAKRAGNHIGTLGGGNHFIEICLDTEDQVWVMCHSGSRGIGNRIGSYFIEAAKEEMRRYFVNLPDKDLSYVVQGSELFDDYWLALDWAQDFARVNRELIMSAAHDALEFVMGREIGSYEVAVNCHHNYVSWEQHGGQNIMVTRKGAVRITPDTMGIIPGSMGAKSFIVRGKAGKPLADSFNSCSHGAGRAMSRTAAKKLFTLEDHIKATEGVECRKDEDVIDETPGAYKDIDAVMAAQADHVEIVHTLRQIVCVKG